MFCLVDGRLPGTLQQFIDSRNGRRHAIGQLVVGIGRVAQQRRLLLAQPHDPRSQRTVVVLACVGTACAARAPDLLAQLAPLGERQKRLRQRRRQRDHVGAFRQTAFTRRLQCRVQNERRHAGTLVSRSQRQGKRRLVGEHVLGELRG